MTTPPQIPQPVQPLPDDVPRQLATANAAWAKLRRMCKFAAFDAWSLAILGALSLICGGYGSVSGFFVSVVLGVTAYIEFRSLGRLRRLDPMAPMHLAKNQLILAAGLILYAGWNLFEISHDGALPAALTAQLSQAVEMDRQATDMAKTAVGIMYGVLILFAIFVQGGTALYYLSRRKYLQGYLEQTPPWILQMQREHGVT